MVKWKHGNKHFPASQLKAIKEILGTTYKEHRQEKITGKRLMAGRDPGPPSLSKKPDTLFEYLAKLQY